MDFVWLIVAAAAFLALGLFLLLSVRKKINSATLEIKASRTSTIAELEDMFLSMAESGFEGNYRQFVELTGTAVADPPVSAPYSGQPTAYYTAEVKQVYQERVVSTDKDGTKHERLVRKESSISKEKSGSVLTLRDSDGKTIALETEASGLSMDLSSTYDQFEAREAAQNRRYGFLSSFTPRSDTLGYRMLEKTIPLHQPLYIIGEAYKRGDALYIGAPADKQKPFIISSKSEAEVLKSKKAQSVAALVFGFIFLIVAVVCLCMGIGAAVNPEFRQTLFSESASVSGAGSIASITFSSSSSRYMKAGDEESKYLTVETNGSGKLAIEDFVFVSGDPNIAEFEIDNITGTHVYYKLRAFSPGQTKIYVTSADGKVKSAEIKVVVE